MGSHSWSEHLDGADLQAAFRIRVDADRDAYGHDAYTGTVAQAYGVHPVTHQVCHPQEAAFLADQLGDTAALEPPHDYSDPTARCEAEKVGDRRASKLLLQLGRNAGITTQRIGVSRGEVTRARGAWGGTIGDLPTAEKGGAAYAIPTADPANFTVTERAIPLDVTRLGLTASLPWDPAVREHLYDALDATLGRPPRIAAIEILDDNPRYATTVVSTDGPVITRYRLYRRGHHGRLSPLEDTFATMASARARIRELLDSDDRDRWNSLGWDSGEVEYVALGERVRQDGSPLLVGRRELISRLVVYTVRLVAPAKSNIPVTGWQIYGVAGS